MKFRLINLIIAICFYEISFSQQKVFDENFEKEYLTTWTTLNSSPKLYAIHSYTPNQKSPLNISSEINDSAHSEYYVESCCDDTNDLRSYFSIIFLFDKIVPEERQLMVVDLDSCIVKNETYTVEFDSKYNPYCKYKIDSIGLLFLERQTDIKDWLAEKEFHGQYMNLSLNDINKRSWKTLGTTFIAGSNYRYLIIGNLKKDKDVLVKTMSACTCEKKPKGYFDYSELYIDNVSIKTIN